MNRIFRTIRCEATRNWIATSGRASAKRCGASSANVIVTGPVLRTAPRGSALAVTAVFWLTACLAPPAFALSNTTMCANYCGSDMGYGAGTPGLATCSSGVNSWVGGVTVDSGHVLTMSNARVRSQTHERPKGTGKRSKGEPVPDEIVVASGDTTKMFDTSEMPLAIRSSLPGKTDSIRVHTSSFNYVRIILAHWHKRQDVNTFHRMQTDPRLG